MVQPHLIGARATVRGRVAVSRSWWPHVVEPHARIVEVVGHLVRVRARARVRARVRPRVSLRSLATVLVPMSSTRIPGSSAPPAQG